jgi:hypothetical protein
VKKQVSKFAFQMQPALFRYTELHDTAMAGRPKRPKTFTFFWLCWLQARTPVDHSQVWAA